MDDDIKYLLELGFKQYLGGGYICNGVSVHIINNNIWKIGFQSPIDMAFSVCLPAGNLRVNFLAAYKVLKRKVIASFEQEINFLLSLPKF